MDIRFSSAHRVEISLGSLVHGDPVTLLRNVLRLAVRVRRRSCVISVDIRLATAESMSAKMVIGVVS